MNGIKTIVIITYALWYRPQHYNKSKNSNIINYIIGKSEKKSLQLITHIKHMSTSFSRDLEKL